MANDEVLVYNSYSVKDALRGLEFRFDQERRVWAKPVYEVRDTRQSESETETETETERDTMIVWSCYHIIIKL